ncbi:MAG: biofilm PGA synthesis N-glycosyltransferase PgaC [Paraglaciecola sp.]|jgi:biofilm PGA synthesis N-glycosyltransferase PgaC
MNLSGLEILFWASIFVVFYAYVGYGIVLFILTYLKRLLTKREDWTLDESNLPNVTFVVAAYNEERWIEDKIKNCLAFDYPKEKIQLFFVTDGSTDNTAKLIKDYKVAEEVTLKLFHKDGRAGKIAAVERIMEFVETPITIYTDANTDVNPQAIKNIVKFYQDEKVGAVAGEKRIAQANADDAAGAGEGIYWKYESQLKKWDSEFNTVVGAAGELFSIRTKLFQSVPQDTIIEDFYMTMRIAQQGYKVKYAFDATASEGQSATVGEELKRKIRIAAGGLQATWRLRSLLNIFKYPVLAFQFISHRVLRWTLAPLALPIILVANILLAKDGNSLYQIILACQAAFYAFALLGYIMEQQKMKIKAFFVPYYFCIMNYAVYRGFVRAVSGSQSVLWERAKRA